MSDKSSPFPIEDPAARAARLEAELATVRTQLGDALEVVARLTSTIDTADSHTERVRTPKDSEILIVTDNQGQADRLFFTLDGGGFRVVHVDNGRLALDSARRHKPALIMSDVAVPGMDGFDLCRAVKADAALRGVPVVLLTTQSSPEQGARAREAGADCHFTKPYDESALLAGIDALLGAPARVCEQPEKEPLASGIAASGKACTSSSEKFVNRQFAICEDAVTQDRDSSRVLEELRLANERLENEVAERQRAETEAKAHASRQSVLAQLTHLTLTGIEIVEFLNEVARQTALALDAQWCHVFERLPDGGTLVVRGLAGPLGEHQSLVVDERGLCGRPLLADEPLIVDDMESEERRMLPPWLQGEDVRSAIAVPFRLSGGLYGVLAAFSKSPSRFDPDAAPFLRGVGDLIGHFVARVRSEEQLRLRDSALESAANAIVITDRESVVQWVNQAFTRLTGYTADEAVGRTPRELLRSGLQDAAFYRKMWETLLDGRIWEGDLSNRRKDRTIYTEHQTITPVRDRDGRIRHFICIKDDITERLDLEEQFRQAQRMEAVGQLAGGIAHDFNNQLFVINGYCDLLATAVAGQAALEAPVQEIQAAARRSALLTKQLLAFSCKQVLQPKILDLNAELSAVRETLGRLIGEDIQLTIVLEDGAGHVRVDPGQLQQVLMNVAVNAKDAMPDGGKLTIETAAVEFDASYAHSHRDVSEGTYVSLSVSDTGIGMDEATLSRVFEPFFTTKTAGKGTGLGLPTVLGIVKQSGGHVSIQSELGCGTTLRIYLPCVDEPAEKAAADSIAPREGGSETILYTEDEAALRRLVCRVLEDHGYRVLTASNGKEALEVAATFDDDIHLLLTDVIMPEMSGTQLAAQLTDLRPRVRVIYTSGYASDDILSHHGVLEGGHVLLTKPCPTDVMLRAVREVLDSQSGGAFRTGRVLVVDDSRDERVIEARLLSKAGFTVLEADSGPEALALLERETVDAVITDVNMTGMDGFVLTGAIRSMPRCLTLPVIVLTGACTDEEVEHSRAVGATACLDKGITGQQGLLAALANLQ